MPNKLTEKQAAKARENGKLGGAPKKEVDYPMLDKMCAIHCTGEECAAMLDMDYDTLNNRLKDDGNLGFSDYFTKKSANGKMSLRRRQYTAAVTDGNPTMMIWLGKQWLGQKEPEKADSSIVVTNNIMPVPTADSIEGWEASAQAQQDEILNRND